MKTTTLKKLPLLLLFSVIFTSFTAVSQVGGWKPDLVEDANKALEEMIEKQPKLQSYKDKAYGYAVFPKVTKGAIGIGGAGGKGVVFKGSTPMGQSSLSQATIGFQLGGQQYKEVIFFENKAAYDRFTNEKVKFDGQASAVAITEGASVDVNWKDGMAIFTQTSGGLMFEASIGGQHFSFKPKE
ncbi:lipid-binding SYLF domain-containing protein [Lutimonas zeaxanthinifaciens]|uniref:lipid-binding SYLF domain-containing protein n=1 Tax=Lutimonas zeaxanthinifaciens TaxID=3060215 RepID=UPI00265D4F01|nr:lipid-binding SYLF domain-containing protein [Lutimonas sp. YSD2104]WKK67435.1 lipid-binding SYLF domain-containing protein [Lutimonas sp. YSD2104]